jgi:hypothetical protein
MGRPFWEVAHLGDVVENFLQGSIDLDAFFDAHSIGSSFAPITFYAAMMPPDEAWRAAATLYSPTCLVGEFSGVRLSRVLGSLDSRS